MGIMDVFRSQPAQQPVQQQQPQGQQQQPQGGNPNQPKTNAPAGGSVQLENAGGQPGAQGQPGTGTESTPLDQFKDLWKTDESGDADKGKPKNFLNIDPKAILENSKKLNYSQLIPQELAAKALGGDVQSFHQILNTVGQASFANAMQANLALMERGLSSAEARFFERVPSEVKRHALADSSYSENPALNHEAVQPMLRMIQEQMQTKYPNASTAEIQKMSKEYLTSTLSAIQPADGTGAPGKKPGSKSPNDLVTNLQSAQPTTDWDDFLGMSNP